MKPVIQNIQNFTQKDRHSWLLEFSKIFWVSWIFENPAKSWQFSLHIFWKAIFIIETFRILVLPNFVILIPKMFSTASGVLEIRTRKKNTVQFGIMQIILCLKFSKYSHGGSPRDPWFSAWVCPGPCGRCWAACGGRPESSFSRRGLSPCPCADGCCH